MKKLLLLALVLNLYSFVEAQAQSQTPAWQRPTLSPHSKRIGLAKPSHARLKEMEGDSSSQDERRRNLLPPHLQRMTNLPPHLAAERRWLLQSKTRGATTGATELEPANQLDRLYPPYKRPLAHKPSPLKNFMLDHSIQSFQPGATQTLSGGVQEAWVARYDEPSHADDFATAMAIDGAGNIYVTGSTQFFGSFQDFLTVKYNAVGVKQWTASYQLEQNYPNPFNPSTVISFALPEAGKATVAIYSITGQLVRELVNGEMAAGRHAISWNGRNQSGEVVAAGMYLYRLVAHGTNGELVFSKTQRMTMVK